MAWHTWVWTLSRRILTYSLNGRSAKPLRRHRATTLRVERLEDRTVPTITTTQIFAADAVSPPPITGTEATSISLVARLTDDNAADAAAPFEFFWTATNGAGTDVTTADDPNTGTQDAFTFTPHDEGTYTVTVHAVDQHNASGPTATLTIAVGDAAVSLTKGPDITNAVQGVPIGPPATQVVTVANLTDANSGALANTPGDFTATIYWGDGSTDTATFNNGFIQPNGDIQGSHTYAQAGTFYVGVTLTDVGGSTFTLNGTQQGGTDGTKIVVAANQRTVIDGPTDNTAINDTQTATPFSSIVLVDPDAGETYSATVTLSAAANGTLSSPAGGSYDAATGVYTSPSGLSLAQTQSALRGLVFNPTVGQVPLGQAIFTNFTISVNDSGLTASDNSTNVRTSAFVGPVAPAWQTQAGMFTINGANLVASAVAPSLAVNTDVFAADVSVQADVTLAPSGSSRAGLIARHTGSGDTNMYLAELVATSNNAVAFIYRNLDGVWTPLGAAPGLPATGTLRFDVLGNSLKLFFNGVLVASAVDNAIQGPGYSGVRGNSATYDQDSVARLFSAASFGDNFNRADSSSLGDNFIKIKQADNQASISANQLSMPNSTLDLAVYSGMFAADVSVQADVALDATQVSRAGLIARYTGVGDANMYLAQIVGTSSNAVAFIYRNVGGVWTRLATATGLSGTGTLRFDVIGNALTLSFNGATIASAVDNAAIQGPGLTGVRGDLATYDNYSAARVLTPPFSDNFNRPDSSNLGVNFVKKAGNLSISNNQLSTPNPGPNVAIYAGMFATDVSVQADVALGGTLLSRAGLVARYAGGGDTNMYLAQIVRAGSNVVAFIYRNVDDVWTRLATASVASGTGTLRFDVIGDNLALFMNNVLVTSAVDDAIQGPGYTGVRGNAATFDNLTCTSHTV